MNHDQTQPIQLPAQRFEFTGDGGEYFRIWIVNVLLSVLTLGIYSAWAKVRRLQYFYRHTQVAESSFDYHGQPIAILKGRLIAFALLLLYNFAQQRHSFISLPILLAIGAVMPWLLRNSLRFRFHNSSWRGLRFGFRGTKTDAYVVFLVLGGLGLITGFLWPLFHSRMKRYQHGNAWFGQTQGSFTATDGEFYGVYLRASLMTLGPIIVMIAAIVGLRGGGASMQAMLALTVIIVLVAMVMVGPYLQARLQNLIWNRTRLGEHRFESTLSARTLFFIYFTNFLLTALTLGLFRPWAVVRLARYHAQCLTLIPASNLDEFVAGAGEAVGATGEGTADLFDFDIAL